MIRKFGLYPPFVDYCDGKNIFISNDYNSYFSNYFEAKVGVITISSILYDRLEFNLETYFFSPKQDCFSGLRPIYYYKNSNHLGASDCINAGQVILTYCNDTIINNLDLSNGTAGVALHYCRNITISDNDLTNIPYNGAYGIYLSKTENATPEQMKAAEEMYSGKESPEILSIAGEKAFISVTGPLSRTGPTWIDKFFGFGGTAYNDIQDAIKEASHLGIKMGNALCFSHTGSGISNSMKSVSKCLSSYRGMSSEEYDAASYDFDAFDSTDREGAM